MCALAVGLLLAQSNEKARRNNYFGNLEKRGEYAICRPRFTHHHRAFFAVHALKTGRQMYWLIILFSFPLLGSLVYFFAEYFPSSKVERGVRQVSNKAIQLLDPTRELREARQAFDLTPTVQNRMRLAAALDGAGEYHEAVEQFDACLSGPFANDPEVCFGAAKAKLHVNQAQAAVQL